MKFSWRTTGAWLLLCLALSVGCAKSTGSNQDADPVGSVGLTSETGDAGNPDAGSDAGLTAEATDGGSNPGSGVCPSPDESWECVDSFEPATLVSTCFSPDGSWLCGDPVDPETVSACFAPDGSWLCQDLIDPEGARLCLSPEGLLCADLNGTEEEESACYSSDERGPCSAPVPQEEQHPLPLERTYEPCNGVDDDNDGYTDPHCPNVRCTSNRDCTPGLLRDADCNPAQSASMGCHGEHWDGPGCNHANSQNTACPDGCWGVLCPAGQQCFDGQCIPYGNKGPCQLCNGMDCAPFSRCIAQDYQGYNGRRCDRDCDHEPCPEGFQCKLIQAHFEGHVVNSWMCYPPAMSSCANMVQAGMVE